MASILSLEPIRTSTRTELIAQQIMNSLAQGALKPGDRLPPERELAVQLRVGRSTIREALKLLALSGLLEARQGDGTYVRENFQSFLIQQVEWPMLLSVQQVDMVLEVRQPLEVQAVMLAAERRTSAELEKIAAIRPPASEDERNIELETEFDLQFHNAIAVAAHNELLSTLMNSLQNILRQYIHLSNHMTDNLETTLDEHSQIYHAIAARDVDSARSSMLQHLQMSKQLILKSFSSDTNQKV